jgi:hypothetical protein
MERVSRILWGPTSENVFDAAWPFDHMVPRRKWRKDSRLDVFPSGARESLVTGRDFGLPCEIGWIPGYTPTDYASTPWSGPLGADAFLAWCEDGGTFRFVPDIAHPNVYADGCALVAPDGVEPRLEDDGTFRLSVTIIHPTIDLHLLMRGIIAEYVPGASLTDPIVHSFTRATVANFSDVDGNAAQAASGVLRDRHYIGATRVTLLEQARSNLLDNGSFESDTAGANANASTIASSSAFARYGTKSLKVTTTNVAFSGAYFLKRAGTRAAAAAGDRITSDVWVYAPAASVGKTIQLGLVWYDAGASTISVSTQTAVALVAGWNRLSLTATAPALTASLIPTVYTDAGQGVFDFYIDLVTLQVGYFATSEIPTSTVVASRNGEQLDLILPHGYKPGKYTILVRMLPEWPRGVTSSLGSATPQLALLQKSGGSPRIGIYLDEATSRLYGNVSDDAGTNVGDFGFAAAPAGSALVDLMLQVDDAALQGGFAINATPSLGSITNSSVGLFDRLTLYGYGHGVTLVRLAYGLQSYARMLTL